VYVPRHPKWPPGLKLRVQQTNGPIIELSGDPRRHDRDGTSSEQALERVSVVVNAIAVKQRR
jgi:hypothetical protein